MKRFTILLLALIAFAVLKAEEEGVAKQACKCAEGEANCPCLAQAKSKSNNVITTNVNAIC
jgi:hypothetical protein